MEPSNYRSVERLLDGSMITIRAIRPDDREGFVQAFQQFAKSPASIHFRFHGFKRSISGSEATQMTEIYFVDHVALVVTRGADSDKRLIGVGRYIVCDA